MKLAFGWFDLHPTASYCFEDDVDPFWILLSRVLIYEYLVQMDYTTPVDVFPKDLIDPSFERCWCVA